MMLRLPSWLSVSRCAAFLGCLGAITAVANGCYDNLLPDETNYQPTVGQGGSDTAPICVTLGGSVSWDLNGKPDSGSAGVERSAELQHFLLQASSESAYEIYIIIDGVELKPGTFHCGDDGLDFLLNDVNKGDDGESDADDCTVTIESFGEKGRTHAKGTFSATSTIQGAQKVVTHGSFDVPVCGKDP